TTIAVSLARRSVTFPLPSSPHWVPTTTVAGTAGSSRSTERDSVARRRGAVHHPPLLAGFCTSDDHGIPRERARGRAGGGPPVRAGREARVRAAGRSGSRRPA